MTTTLFSRHFLRAMVWQAETPQRYTLKRRTPTARRFQFLNLTYNDNEHRSNKGNGFND